MNKNMMITAALALTACLAAKAQNKAISFHSSNGNYWRMKTEKVSASTGTAQITISTTADRQQTIKGWGTCFNELDYDAWSLLSESDRTLFNKRVFNPNGDLRLNVGRISVGASDYACDWYSCDETSYDGTNSDGTKNYATDFTMEHFTIERDRQKVIPSIKAAQAENPNMTFWASPWSPPQWMKTNKHYAQRVTSTNGCPFGVPPFENDQFIDDERYYNAYCLYFDKFIQAYKAEGINITALAYQNEAYSNTPYPGCSWTAATTGKFLGKYLGPYMAEHQPDLTLIVGTMNTNRYDVFKTILESEGVSTYCKQVGFQWEGGQQIANIRRDFPGFELVQTESECGSGTFDWNAAAHTFQLCNHYLANGVTTYTYWNAILKDNGASNWGWVQNALVQVNSTSKTAKYCPEFYAYKHYTHLIPAGSVILKCDESNLLTSALTPDGNVVIVIGNEGSSEKVLTVNVDGTMLTCTVAPKSFASYVVGTEENVTKVLKSEAQGLADIESASLTSEQQSALSAALSSGTYDDLFAAVAEVGTHKELMNANFTSGADYWTVNNVAASGDIKAATVLGKTCFNNWSNNFTSLGIYQDLFGVEPGLYTVTAKSVCGEGNITDQHVYIETSTHLAKSPVKADDTWDAAHWETQTTPVIYVAEGDYLRVGYASTSGGGTKGWFCVTDFVLTRVGDLTTDFDMEANRKSDLTTLAPQEVGAGTYFLYDLTSRQFLNYDHSSSNFPQLSDTPTRITLSSNGEGTYAIAFDEVNYSNGNYLKIGTWNGRFIFNDATDANHTKWTFNAVAGKNNTYTISSDTYAETALSGAYYIAGANASANWAEAHEFMLVSMGDYVAYTGNASPALVNAATSDTKRGWSRDNNSASGYAEQPSAIQSSVHTGYGISHWRASAVSNSNLIYQTVSGLPAGLYTLQAYAATTVFNDNKGNANKPGCYVFANDAEVEVTTANYGLYTVNFTLAEGAQLTLGLKAKQNEGNNWCFLSDVKLTYLGDHLTIDEDQSEAAPLFDGVNVKLHRTLSADYWNTFCLPFSLTAQQLASSPLSGAAIKQYDHVEGNVMYFADATEIVAGRPYLVKPASTIENPLFSGVSTTVQEGATEGTESFQFKGLLTRKGYAALGTTSCYLSTSGSVKQLTSGSLKGMRAYFVNTSSSSARIAFGSDESVGIESIVVPVSSALYDLSGRRVMPGQARGIVIKDGVKLVK